MSNYMERSQTIRKEIADTPAIMKVLQAYAQTHQIPQAFLGGESNHHYSVGPLPSRVWVAVRESTLSKEVSRETKKGFNLSYQRRTLAEELEKLEEFCQEAERLSDSSRYLVTSFCVGASYKEGRERRGVILLEDLTQGGNISITPSGGGDYGTIAKEKRRVFFDLSRDERDTKKAILTSDKIRGIRYFKPENIFKIN